MPRTTVTVATSAEDLERAMTVWEAANAARRRPAGPVRTARVRDKLEQGELVLLATYGDRPAGMALAETFVDGAPDPATGHVSMVFVDPALWGLGIGTRLLRYLQAPPPGRSWDRLSVWTRLDNRRARRLYASAGFVETTNRASLQDGDQIMQLIWTRG